MHMSTPSPFSILRRAIVNLLLCGGKLLGNGINWFSKFLFISNLSNPSNLNLNLQLKVFFLNLIPLRQFCRFWLEKILILFNQSNQTVSSILFFFFSRWLHSIANERWWEETVGRLVTIGSSLVQLLLNVCSECRGNSWYFHLWKISC